MGKKKGDKLARMSDEERARYLQHRAEIEEEARRRKQQLIAIFMKNKLKREEAFSRLNLAKINQEWRSVLRNLKCEELRDEILVVEQYFGDALARKNRTIERLLGDLDGCEEIYVRMLSSHVRNVNTLIVLHTERADFWRSGYLADKKVLLNTFHREMAAYKERKLGGFKELECVFYGLEARKEKEQKAMEDVHLQKIDNIKSKMILQLQNITDESEHHMEQLWREFQSVLATYLQYTEQFHDEYLQLRQRDNDDTKIIRFHYGEVLRTTNMIAELKHRLDVHQTDHRVHVAELQRYKRLLQERQALRKQTMEEGCRRDRENLRWMVVKSDAAIMTLRALNKKAENILNIGVMCSKLETDREKLRLNAGQGTQIEATEQHTISNKNHLGDFEKDTMAILSDMENFWMRYNNASIDCACLAEEKATLKSENRQLKDQLKMYLTNVTIVEGSGGTAKAKLRPSSMRVERCEMTVASGSGGGGDGFGKSGVGLYSSKQRRRPVTCIEGNLSQAVRSRSLIESRVARMPDVYAQINYYE